MLFGVLAESAERTLFFSKLDFKLLIDLQQSFLVVALQAVNLLVAQRHYHAENMGCLRAEFIPLGALHGFRISLGRKMVAVACETAARNELAGKVHLLPVRGAFISRITAGSTLMNLRS